MPITTLSSVKKRFPTRIACIQFLESVRWQSGVRCPHCDKPNTTPVESGLRHHCNVCYSTFSVTVRTFMWRTKIDLQKWFAAISLIAADGNTSARKLALAIRVDKDTALRIATRIRRAVAEDDPLITQLRKTF
jgi:transposase-like protein